MLTPPSDTSLDAVADAVRGQFGLEVAPLTFVPAGEDSWNMVGGGCWVSLRRDVRGHVPAAYRLAREMRDAELRGVVAPLRRPSGDVVGEVDGRPLLVFPHVDATPVADLPEAPTSSQVVDLLTPVHAFTTTLPLPVETFEVPFEKSLRAALGWAQHGDDLPGPLSAPLRDALLLERSCILSLLAETREVARRCREEHLPLVVTHGDVSDRNVLDDGTGLLVIDWGGAALAPVERDWFHVARCFGEAPAGDPHRERFYRNRWVISELEEYATILRRRHTGTADDLAMWRRFTYWLTAAREETTPAQPA